MSKPDRFTASTYARISLPRRFLMFWVRHLQQAIASLGEMWRTPSASMMTIAVLGVSLALPASFHLLLKNTQTLSAQWEHAAEITLFLNKTQSVNKQQQFVRRIGLYPEIESVRYISSDEGMEEFKALSGFGEALNYLDENPLPAVVLITPQARLSSAQGAQMLLDKLLNEQEVAEGKLDIQWLERLEAMLDLVSQVIIIIAVLLLTSVILIIGNTMRLAILNRRSEIEVLKLIGATDAFIQRPFLYTGLWFGVISGILAATLSEIMLIWMEQVVHNFAVLYQSNFRLQGLSFSEFLLLMALSGALGLFSSMRSVRHHIKAIEPSA